jgi:hypothetical protein
MTLLAWSLVEFSGGYSAAGALSSATSQLKWGADYLMKAHITPSSFVVQVRPASLLTVSTSMQSRHGGALTVT